MSLKLNEISVKGYEKVLHATNETTKLDCIISIHNTKLGPALGGVRSWSYNSFDEQKADALKLSEAMTLKNSICGINFGGGKAVLNLKNTKKTPGLYQSYAEVVEALQGDYFTAGDVNTFKEDLIQCSKVSKYVYGINVETSGVTSTETSIGEAFPWLPQAILNLLNIVPASVSVLPGLLLFNLCTRSRDRRRIFGPRK